MSEFVIKDVTTSNSIVDVNQIFFIGFKVLGAKPASFTFPFSNESLYENKIEFIKEGLDNGVG